MSTEAVDRGHDLLFSGIALQMSFITREQFVEVMSLLPNKHGKTAEELFAEEGYLKPSQAKALRPRANLPCAHRVSKRRSRVGANDRARRRARPDRGGSEASEDRAGEVL